ncbi:MAG TPA: peptidoglycan-binding protein [Blastocatellia bacterium]|nr:peptidoglycan-binding protein [Blastocatellia bacterium]
MEIRKYVCGLISLVAIAAMVFGVAVQSNGQDSRPRYSSRPNADRSWTVPEDTIISVQMNGGLSSRNSHVGDKFTATVTIPIYVNGRAVIPAGTVVEGRVTQVTPAKRMSKSGTIAIDFDSLVFPNGSRMNLVGNLTSDDPETRRRIDEESRVSGKDGRSPGVFIGGGGAVGAVLGGIAGGGKGAVVGGVLGAGAGVAGVLLSKGEEAQVPSGTPFGVQLRQALVIREGLVSEPGDGGNQDVDQRDTDPRDVDPRDASANEPPRPAPQPDYSRGERLPRETTRPEPVTRNEPPEAAGPVLPLSSPEMLRRAQVVLKEQGYYEGEADGVMSPRTSVALKTYQREHNISESGDLDPQTAKSLGILGASDSSNGRVERAGDRTPDSASSSSTVMANVLSATANRTADGVIQVLINTQANTGGWKWFGEHVINGDTLEVYARAIRPTGMVTQALTRGRIELNVRDGVEYVRRVVVHSAGPDQTLMLGGRTVGATGAGGGTRTGGASGMNLQRQAEELLSEYQRVSGLRLTGASVELDGRRQYRESEIDLLFAIDSFANTAQLYSRLIGSLQDPQSQRGAALALARQARRTDRVISTSQVAGSLTSKWDGIRQDVLRLMQSHNITPSELDN